MNTFVYMHKYTQKYRQLYCVVGMWVCDGRLQQAITCAYPLYGGFLCICVWKNVWQQYVCFLSVFAILCVHIWICASAGAPGDIVTWSCTHTYIHTHTHTRTHTSTHTRTRARTHTHTHIHTHRHTHAHTHTHTHRLLRTCGSSRCCWWIWAPGPALSGKRCTHSRLDLNGSVFFMS